MNAIYRMGAAAVLMLALLSPAMACVLPGPRPSAEAACCKRMNGDCSAMRMPPSQQCCQMKAHTGQIVMVQAQNMPLQADSVRVGVAPVSIQSSVPRAEYPILASVSHPPPILRI